MGPSESVSWFTVQKRENSTRFSLVRRAECLFHTCRIHTRAQVCAVAAKGGEGDGATRTYLFLSDSCRKNSVDVNERQLVLIKNEIAPPYTRRSDIKTK